MIAQRTHLSAEVTQKMGPIKTFKIELSDQLPIIPRASDCLSKCLFCDCINGWWEKRNRAHQFFLYQKGSTWLQSPPRGCNKECFLVLNFDPRPFIDVDTSYLHLDHELASKWVFSCFGQNHKIISRPYFSISIDSLGLIFYEHIKIGPRIVSDPSYPEYTLNLDFWTSSITSFLWVFSKILFSAL